MAKLRQAEMEVQHELKKYEDKARRNNELKQKQINDQKERALNHRSKWESRRSEIVNKDFAIDPDNLKNIQISSIKKGAKRSPSNSPSPVMGDRLIILDKPSLHLSNFTIDRDKINFFSKAQTIVDRHKRSEKQRLKLQKDKLEDLKSKAENKKDAVLANKRHLRSLHQDKMIAL